VHIGGVRYAVRIPRDRRGLFRPFLLEFLRLQDEAQEGIVSRLYACGMTTRDIGATLRDIYGRAYAPSSVSRMLEATAADGEKVNRPLGTAARPITPLSSNTSHSTVGLPRESRISRAKISTIALMVLLRLFGLRMRFTKNETGGL